MANHNLSAKHGTSHTQTRQTRRSRASDEHAPYAADPSGGPTWTALERRPLDDQRRVQRKALNVRPAGDRYEQEADRVADRVVAAPSPEGKDGVGDGISSPVPVIGAISSVVQREADPSPDKTGPRVREDLAGDLQTATGGGDPLDAETKSFMEPRFGQDFSQVRVHTDGKAADMAGQLQARAFTHGSDIFMGSGQSGPDSATGRHLLAHELTHVVQQGGGRAVQAKPLIQRDPDSSAMASAATEGASESEDVAPAPAPAVDEAQKERGTTFVKAYVKTFKDIMNDKGRQNLGAVRTALAELAPGAAEVGDPQCQELLTATEGVLTDIFSSTPPTVEEALTTKEADKLRAFAEKKKLTEKAFEAKGKATTLTRERRKKKIEKKSGWIGKRAAADASIKLAERKRDKAGKKAHAAIVAYEALFDGSGVSNALVMEFIDRLAVAEVAKHPEAKVLFRGLASLYGVSDVTVNLEPAVRHHVGSHIIAEYERVSGLSIDHKS